MKGVAKKKRRVWVEEKPCRRVEHAGYDTFAS